MRKGQKKTPRRKDECSKCRGVIEANRVLSNQKFCKECQRQYLNEYRKTENYKTKVWAGQKEKHYARSYTNMYVRRGAIEKLPCRVCGNPDSEIHHPNYKKWKEVEFYCREHHLDHHKTA